MTDTERLDFIEKHEMDIGYIEFTDEFVIGSYETDGFIQFGRDKDLRTAIDKAVKEIRGLNDNATTN